MLPTAQRADAAILTPTNGSVHIELRHDDGTLVGERELPIPDDCGEATERVAVTIASWESEVSPIDDPIALPAPQLAVQTRAQRPTQLRWEVEASLLGSIAAGVFAPGAAADVFLGRHAFPFGVRVGVAGLATRELALGRGEAAWGRAAVMLSPSIDLLRRLVHVELRNHLKHCARKAMRGNAGEGDAAIEELLTIWSRHAR